VLLVLGVLVVAAAYAVLVVVNAKSESGNARPAGPSGQATALYVSPGGSDTNDGTERTPLQTIQAGLEKATPGTVINLAPGTYREQLTTVRDGAPGAPITIKGPETGKDRSGRYRAVVYGTGRVFSLDHSYYTLDGFTIDGQEQLSKTPFPSSIQAMNAFKDSVRSKVEDGRLVYIGAADDSKDLTGITITNMFLNGAGGECVRLRNNAHDNVISDSVIQYCGMFGKGDGDERATYHNGEGVYIGTSPGSDDQPMHENDPSSHNRVTGNTIHTFGSECFDVKENAHDNVLENNDCAANTEDTDFVGSNVELRGYANVVRNNKISSSAGFSLKIQSDGDEYDDGGNIVEGNQISGATGATLKIKSDAAQGRICGNQVAGGATVDGDFSGDLTAACPTP
jgi:Right handed beta helix region